MADLFELDKDKRQQIIDTLNQDPLKAYKELTVLIETMNGDSEATEMIESIGGPDTLKDLRDGLDVTEQERIDAFQPATLPEQMTELLDKEPEELYKTLYSEYAYGDHNTDQKLQIRSIMNGAKSYLADKGVNADKYLRNQSVVMKGLNFLSNILSIPTNLISSTAQKAITGKWGKVWNGTGWMEFLGELGEQNNQTIRDIIDKSNKGIPLTQEEQDEIDNENKKNTWIGMGLNIALDPLTWIGLTPIGRIGGKTLTLNKAGQASRINQARLAGQVGDSIKTNARFLRNALLGTGDDITRSMFNVTDDIARSSIDDLGKLLAKPKIVDWDDIDDSVGLLRNVSQRLGIAENGVDPIKMTNSVTDFVNRAKDAEKIAAKPLLQFTEKAGKKIERVKNRLIEGTSLGQSTRRAVGTNMPARIAGGDGDIMRIGDETADFIRDTAGRVLDPNDALRDARRFDGYYYNTVAQKQNAIQVAVDDISGIVNNRLADGQTVNDVLTEVVENPSFLAKYGLSLDDVAPVRKAFDDIIIDEVRYGVKSNPLNLSILDQREYQRLLSNYTDEYTNFINKYLSDYDADQANGIIDYLFENPSKYKDYGIKKADLSALKSAYKRTTYNTSKSIATKEWDSLAQKFHELQVNNPYDPQLDVIESRLRQMLNESNGLNLMGTEIADEFDNIAYFTHALTPEAKEFILTLPTGKQRQFKEAIKSFIYKKSSGSQSNIQRRMTGSIGEIDEAAKSGQIWDGLAEWWTKRYPDTPIKIFDTDVNKILGLRGARAARAIHQQKFYEGITPFIFDMPQQQSTVKLVGDWVPTAIKGKYAHPDIAQAIEKTYRIVNDPKATRKLLNTMDDLQRIWKSITLSLYPTTVFRNMLGNFMNSALSLDDLSQLPGLVRSNKDALITMRLANSAMGKTDEAIKLFDDGILKKAYDITTADGRRINLGEIFQEGYKRGIFGTGQRRVLTEGRKGANNTGLLNRFANWFTDTVGKNPLAVANDTVEDWSKFGLFVDGVRRGLPYDEAAKRSFKYLFDYADIPDIFRTSIRRIVPFATWTRKNMPLQISHMLSVPTRITVRSTLQGTQARVGDPTVDERFMSGWLSEGAPVRMGENRVGQPRYVMMENFLPFFDVNRILRVALDDDKVQAFVDEIARDITPLIKTPIEIATNRDLTFRKELLRSKYATKEYMGMRLSPFITRWLQNLRPVSFAEKFGAGEWIAKNLSGQTLTKPEADVRRGLVSYLVITPQIYDIPFSRSISRSVTKGEIYDELTNFDYWVQALKDKAMAGTELTEKDAKDIMTRASNNFWDVQDAYVDGILSRDERAMFMERIVDTLTGD